MKRLASTALAVILILSLSACGGRTPKNEVFSREDLTGRTVGVLSGSVSRRYAERYGSDVDLRLYEDAETMTAALKNGGLDCVIASGKTFEEMRGYSSAVTSLEERYIDARYVLAVSAENRLMLENLNAAIGRLRDSGELDRIASAWESGGGDTVWTAPPGSRTISVAVTADFYPYAFLKEDGEAAGLEIDVVRAICTDLGLTPEFMAVEADMLLYMAESGKTSFAVGRITADPENEGLVYTDCYLHSTQLIVVRK